MDALANFFHKFQVVRRFAFFWCLWMTTTVYLWGMEYVSLHPEKSSIELTAIVGAFLATIATLQGFVLKLYATNQYNDRLN